MQEQGERDNNLAMTLEEAEGDWKTGQDNNALKGDGAGRYGGSVEETLKLKKNVKGPLGLSLEFFWPQGAGR